ncbi:hypothetical protein SAMN05192533_11430 [Mesobacillus persicus]|uniref:Uncharacterized protein n=1 Tax=Mesobacillus persicus TaxID=930146 RepID=A0A1H8GZB3_9BACI|nr:hypothetical protein [Mesobacillus persicus]SEN49316.1 hypothetical protein SAMN05192533_11430 [Mesobacillus persicus]
MNNEMSDMSDKQDEFFNLLKRTYEKGMSEKEITVERLLEDLKIDIRRVIAK